MVHAELAGVVDHQATGGRRAGGVDRRDRRTRAEQADIPAGEVERVEVAHLQHALGPERDLLADRARRGQGGDVVHGEVALGQRLDDLAADGSGGSCDGDAVAHDPGPRWWRGTAAGAADWRRVCYPGTAVSCNRCREPCRTAWRWNGGRRARWQSGSGGRRGMVDAPGEPGQPPRWVATGKDGVGRSLCDDARVWFTLGRGILNEIAYPRIEQTAVRDFGLIVTDGAGLFAEERRDCDAETVPAAPGVPAYHITGTHQGGLFRLHKRLIADPRRPAVLLRVRRDLRTSGGSRDGRAATGACAAGAASGERRRHRNRLDRRLQGPGDAVRRRAGHRGGDGRGLRLARALGRLRRDQRRLAGPVAARRDAVAVRAGAERHRGADRRARPAGQPRTASWCAWRSAGSGPRRRCAPAPACWTVSRSSRPATSRAGAAGWTGLPENPVPMQRTSLMVLRSHECPSMPGARIGSLGVPWAALQSSDEPSACHLVRPRDVVAGAVALLAAGDPDGLGRRCPTCRRCRRRTGTGRRTSGSTA